MSRPLTGPGRDDDPRRIEPGVDDRPVAVEERVGIKPARTSAAAAFALAFGVAAFVCVLIVILSPVGLATNSPTTSRSRSPDTAHSIGLLE